MTIETIKRWEAFLQSDLGSRLSVIAAMLTIIAATMVLAANLPPLPAAVVAVDTPEDTAPAPEPIRLPVILADAPR